MLIFQGLVLGFSAASSPGAFQAYLLARALKDGWRGTWMAAFAPLLSDGPVVLIVLLILTQVPDWFARGLRLAGGLFLLYLAWGVLRSLFRPGNRNSGASNEPAPENGKQRSFWQAALMNVISPGPWLFWSTVAGPAFLRGWRSSPIEGISFVLGFYLAMITVLLVIIALFSALGKADGLIVRVLQGGSGLLLAGFGIYQIISIF